MVGVSHSFPSNYGITRILWIAASLSLLPIPHCNSRLLDLDRVLALIFSDCGRFIKRAI